jgi:hypothetical protein
MKRTHLIITSLAVTIVLASCAGAQKPAPAPMPQAVADEPILASNDVAAPATQPAGESDIAQMIKQRKQQQQQQQPKAVMNGDLPAGHPPIPTNDIPQLPAGHPTMEQMQAAAAKGTAKPASTRPAMFASLSVRAVQGTAGGPAIGAAAVSVELVQGEMVIDKYEATLATDGTATFDGVPTNMSVVPIVRVNYNGVEYTAAGEEINGQNTKQVVHVPVYETTEDALAWAVQMQHVMLEPATDCVRVVEMLAVSNPTNRAWIGKLGADNKRTTQTFLLPADATDVQLAGGFHDCCTKIEQGKVINSMALVPGTSQYRIAYTIPVSSGAATIAIKTSAPVAHLMIFAPDDGAKVSAEGVESGVANMGRGNTRYFKASNVEAGKEIKLSLSNITAAAKTASAVGNSAAGTSAATPVAKLVAGAGGLLIFVVGGMFLLRKAPVTAKAT